MAKLSKAAIAKLPKARHCACERDVVGYRYVKDFCGDILVEIYSKHESSNMSVKRFEDIYIKIEESV